ncbi:MAG: DUF58 domain-containing protein [Ralstonia sp.]|uniref:DUF58 domain-containing protein n=3 Tax=Pseudomonadota TaxID=1224 RepID=A0A9Q2C7S2_RALPI|nr:DUF58 domain-containing protein [Ralstonia pickettii]MBA9844169.1 DUF58 domain-containing protein [Ralstonia pickettii]MBA9849627.1 DUF58 domain-containing protein [Ralstonia pickettii]MBA9878541.1 DUF58 domain-containing protein [Ralstonia pickettii]MBA9880806.1 DUF58 domain-containing protein [Ralstonia pickettii]MBA9888687.1 DUF58 domain-containing protein [Ralstonia pickettii]
MARLRSLLLAPLRVLGAGVAMLPGVRFARARVQRFLQRPRTPREGRIRLDRNHVYILPTAAGGGFALLLVVMLLTSLNYNVSLGFLLTFVLAGVAASAMWQTHRNLVDLEVRGAAGEAVFAGHALNVSVALANVTPWARVGVDVSAAQAAAVETSLDAQDAIVAALSFADQPRGWFKLPRLTVSTRFPLGLFRAWSYADAPLTLLVYPAPEPSAPPLPASFAPDPGDEDDTRAARTHVEEAADQLRTYRPGDALRSIAWKHSARLDTWMSRTGQQVRHAQCVLAWEALPPSMNVEQRLSRLCAWVLAAEHAPAGDEPEYTLSLPGAVIGPARGVAHRDACLRALALWGKPAMPEAEGEVT